MHITRNSEKNKDAEVNLTPLIDVVFLLLIFFMVSTTFTKETRIGIQLPESEGNPQQEEVQFAELAITENGTYILNGQTLSDSSAETLRKVLSQEVKDKGYNQNTPLVLSADQNARHQAVITAMDVAGKIGFQSINLLTQDSQ